MPGRHVTGLYTETTALQRTDFYTTLSMAPSSQSSDKGLLKILGKHGIGIDLTPQLLPQPLGWEGRASILHECSLQPMVGFTSVKSLLPLLWEPLSKDSISLCMQGSSQGSLTVKEQMNIGVVSPCQPQLYRPGLYPPCSTFPILSRLVIQTQLHAFSPSCCFPPSLPWLPPTLPETWGLGPCREPHGSEMPICKAVQGLSALSPIQRV